MIWVTSICCLAFCQRFSVWRIERLLPSLLAIDCRLGGTHRNMVLARSQGPIYHLGVEAGHGFDGWLSSSGLHVIHCGLRCAGRRRNILMRRDRVGIAGRNSDGALLVAS